MTTENKAPDGLMPDELEQVICNYTHNDRSAVRRFLGASEQCGYILTLQPESVDVEGLKREIIHVVFMKRQNLVNVDESAAISDAIDHLAATGRIQPPDMYHDKDNNERYSWKERAEELQAENDKYEELHREQIAPVKVIEGLGEAITMIENDYNWTDPYTSPEYAASMRGIIESAREHLKRQGNK